VDEDRVIHEGAVSLGALQQALSDSVQWLHEIEDDYSSGFMSPSVYAAAVDSADRRMARIEFQLTACRVGISALALAWHGWSLLSSVQRQGYEGWGVP
jgi:hypothetical protein